MGHIGIVKGWSNGGQMGQMDGQILTKKRLTFFSQLFNRILLMKNDILFIFVAIQIM